MNTREILENLFIITKHTHIHLVNYLMIRVKIVDCTLNCSIVI